MKKVLFLYVLSLFIIGCGNSEKELKGSSIENTALNEMLVLETEINKTDITNGNMNLLKQRGKELYNKATVYINNSVNNSDLERVYELAAIGAETAGRYNDAINYFYQAQRKYPDSKKATEYLFNRARILDNILIKKNAARLAYEELMELYPEDSLSQAIKLYLESDLLEKSDQEIIEFLESKN